MRKLVTSVAVTLLLVAGSTSATAAPCKDAKGKFTKCPPAKAVPCKDAKGKFVKCGTAGAKPIK